MLLLNTLADPQESLNVWDFMEPFWELEKKVSLQLLSLHIETLAYIASPSFPQKETNIHTSKKA